MHSPRLLACIRTSLVHVPTCVALAGGYAEDVNDTVEINLGTLHEAMRRFEERGALQEA